MLYGSRPVASPSFLLPYKTIQKNVVVFVLAFPVAGLFLYLLFNPLGSAGGLPRPLVHQREGIHQSDDDGALGKNVHVVDDERRRPDRNYTIHVWMHGERMKRRFLRSYKREENDPYESCGSRNCILTTDDSMVSEADAVMFHLHQTKGPQELPERHPPQQVWIFFTDESPYHTFYASKRYAMSDYNGIFNWSMTYRGDSDIPVPYGRTLPLTESEKSTLGALPNYSSSKTASVAILGSNCGGRNGRWDYVRELKNYIDVDVYGHCGDLKCPGHFTRDCPDIAKYKFYLAFENTNCREYITEKLWWNAYHKDVVPVVMGAPRTDYERLCPPGSFIHVDDFESPADLASYLRELDRNDTAYNEYFVWKRSYKVLNEHGYFGSPSRHLCRICEHLNSGKGLPKIYNDLSSFWSVEGDCQNPKKEDS